MSENDAYLYANAERLSPAKVRKALLEIGADFARDGAGRDGRALNCVESLQAGLLLGKQESTGVWWGTKSPVLAVFARVGADIRVGMHILAMDERAVALIGALVCLFRGVVEEDPHAALFVEIPEVSEEGWDRFVVGESRYQGPLPFLLCVGDDVKERFPCTEHAVKESQLKHGHIYAGHDLAVSFLE